MVRRAPLTGSGRSYDDTEFRNGFCGGDGSSSDDLDLALSRAALDYHRGCSSPDEETPAATLAVKQYHWVTHPDGFREKRYHHSHAGPRIRKNELVSEEQAKVFSQKYNQYFYALTGKHIDFRITPTSQPYVSMLEHCRRRDRVLMTLFESRPRIWELMGGSGADSLAFMLDLDPESVTIVEYGVGDQGEKGEEKKALIHNVNSFCQCFEEYRDAFDPANPGNPAKRVRVEYMIARDFIRKANPINPATGKRDRLSVNMVYLDPSWDKAFYQMIEWEGVHRGENPDPAAAEEEREYKPNEVEEYESTPDDLFHYLQSQIWGPLKECNIEVDCFILKTRWEWSRVSDMLEKINSEYYTPYSIQAVQFQEHLAHVTAGKFGEVKGQYYWMVLVHKKYRTIHENRNEWYMDLVRRGRKVYVDERTVVGPFKPRYTDQLAFPTVYPTPHEHCFEVTPPDYGKARPESKTKPGSTPSRPYKQAPDWRDQGKTPVVLPPRENVWHKRAEDRKQKKEQDPSGYKGRYQDLMPEGDSRLKAKARSRTRVFLDDL